MSSAQRLHTKPPTPSSSSATPPSMQAQVAPSPEPPFVLRSAFDEHMLRAYPNHQPMGEDMVKKVLFAMGATEDTLPRYLAIHNKQWDDIFARAGGKLHTLGAKPQLHDQGTLHFSVPNSALAIRIWPGGMEKYGQYCLDFFHAGDRIAVNTPDRYEIVHVPRPGVFTFGGKLVSWEKTLGKDQYMPAGTEKYSVPEGSRLVLVRPGEDPFYFQVPLRPA